MSQIPFVMSAQSFKLFGLATLLLLSVSSCKKENEQENTNPPVTPGNTNTTLVIGRVTSSSGVPVAGVQLTAGTKAGTSNSDGTFAIADVSSGERVFVSASKAGFFTGSKGVISENNAVTKIEIVLIENTPNFVANAAISNSLLLPDGSGIEFSPNSVQNSNGTLVSGNINVSIVHLSPSDPDFELKAPGGDFIGINTASEERQLYSYGMLMVEMTDNTGNQLELVPGNTSVVRMKVPADQLVTAPTTIPLWHFDETTGKWLEEGTATLQGDTYIGEVSHFSSWNCDLPTARGTVKGNVRDCLGNLMPNIRVRIGQVTAFTDAAGEYEALAPSGISFDVAVESPELGISSTAVPVSPISAGSVNTVPTINVACPAYLTFNLNCTSGSAFRAVVSASWGNNSVSGSTLSPGTFRLAVPANGQTATVLITNLFSGQSYNQTVTFPNIAGGETAGGTFDLCTAAGATINTTFTINGDLFNNQTITIHAIPLAAFSIYSINNSITLGVCGAENYGFSLTFPGKQTGPQSNNDTNSVVATITNNGNSWVADSLLNINVTEYGPVGGRVKGTFSGVFKRFEFNQTTNEIFFYYATVTNGSFEFIRNEDQQ
jgi:hypothetical protein